MLDPEGKTTEIVAIVDDSDEIVVKTRLKARLSAVVEEVGRLKYGDLKPAKRAEAVLLDLVEAQIVAGTEGRRTVPLLAGWREAIDNVGRRLLDAIPAVQLAKLERTGRSRGGYVGVEAVVGGLWAARVDGEDGTFTFSQQFLKPELAALARYQYYLQHKIPYGYFAKEIERVRGDIARQTGRWTERLIRATAIWHCSMARKPVDPAFLHPGEERWMREDPPEEEKADGTTDLRGAKNR